jgi:hypothetical protein
MLKLDTGGRLDMGLGRGSRPPEEVRFAIDSALEEGGFEPSVPLRSKLSRLPGTLFADSYSSNRLTICSRGSAAQVEAQDGTYSRGPRCAERKSNRAIRRVFIFTGGNRPRDRRYCCLLACAGSAADTAPREREDARAFL